MSTRTRTTDSFALQLRLRLAGERRNLRRARAAGDELEILISTGRIADLVGLARRNDLDLGSASAS